eukprot:gene11464-4628_t
MSKDEYDNFFNMIDKNYIQKNGEEHIDKFSMETKLKYYSELKKYQMDKPYKDVPETLFKEMVDTVLNELKYESFPRFIRTTPCEKKLQDYLLKSNVVSPKEAVKFDYSDEDFDHCYVSDKDFEFTKALLNDGYHWELIGSANEENINTFWCNVNFMPKVSFLTNSYMVKYEYVLNFPFEEVISSCIPLNHRLTVDETIANVDTIDQIPFSEMRLRYPSEKFKDIRGHALMKYSLIVPFPLNTRVWFPTVSMSFDSSNSSFIQICKSYKQETDFTKSTEMNVVSSKGGKEKKSKVYMAFNFLSTTLKPLSANSTLFTQINLVDIGGWGTNQMILKKLAHDRSLKIQKMLVKTINTSPIKKLKEVFESAKENQANDKYLNH